MIQSFGTDSTKSTGPDGLGRTQRWLTLHAAGLPGRDVDSYRFDIADLDALSTLASDTIPEAALEVWQAPMARALLSWAVVHAAVPAAAVAHRHADALCTLANAPDGQDISRQLFGSEVTWIPFAAVGPALARALAISSETTAAIVPRLGVVTWGETLDEIAARVAEFEDAAARRLNLARSESSPPETESSWDSESTLVALRGRLSRGASKVLHLDPSLRAIASRLDAERVVAEARRIEITHPWSTRTALRTVTPEADALDALMVPGIGQVSAGWDESDARSRGRVAAHVHRVAAALIDRGNDGSGVQAQEETLPSAFDKVLRPGLPTVGRVFIVTGAASGIGRDVARHLSGLGAHLGLADVDASGLDLVAEELLGPQGRPVTVAGDLTDETIVDDLVSKTIWRFGGVDGAVFNVGIALPGEIRRLTSADWRRSLEVNTTSHFLLARRLLPALEAQGCGGSLVFIGSKNMFSPGAGFGAYSASKAALAQLARVIAIEAGPFGVRSNIVNPDNVFEGSALWSPELRAQRAAVYGVQPEDLEAYYTKRNLMKVPITGMDVAKAVAFLLSEDASRTTACVLTVDGGVPGVFPR